MRGILLSIIFLGPWLSLGAEVAERVIVDSQGMDCHVYAPAKIDPDETYQLVVGVHGAGGKGKGAAGMKSWAERGDVIVIGPSFQSRGERPYQNGDGVHAEKLIALFKQLGTEFKLRDQMFLHGFSGGSQFAHRFAMNHPSYVCGVSAHSGGSWATDGFGKINLTAKAIPFAISCGEKDTAMSFSEAKFNRLRWFERFQEEIAQKGFCHLARTWPDVGHRISPGAWDLTRQCFQLATGLPGQSATEEVVISGEWKNLAQIPKRETTKNAAVPSIDPARLARVTKVAFARADQDEISNDKLVVFMEQYPPVLWKAQPGSGKLLAQCERAAAVWKASAVRAGRFEGETRRQFETFSKGLTGVAPSAAEPEE